MSERRLVITAVLAGSSQSEVARSFGVFQSWISRLMARYAIEGQAAFEPRSRRPHTSPNATAAATTELVLRIRKELSEAGLDAGADTVGWHLTHHHQTTLSRATIHRVLTRAGTVTPEPGKRSKSSSLRFAAEMTNETWRSDCTHYRLTSGADTEIITWLDDHSRLALHVSAPPRITGPIVLATFRQAADLHGHSTTCGKVARFQQTMKNWLAAQPDQPATIAQLRPYSMSSSPPTTTTARSDRCRSGPPPRPPTPPAPRPPPAPTAPPTPTTASAPTRSTRPAASPCAWPAACTASASAGPTPEPTSCCFQDLHVRVIDATGELLRELTIDPTRDYQPTGRRPPGPAPKRQ